MSERLVINLGRYRNFSFSIPFDHRESLLNAINSRAKLFYGQEDLSDNSYHHIECFINTKNSCSAIALSKALGIKYWYRVQLADGEREMDYCCKKDTMVQDGLVLTIGTPPVNNKTAQSIYIELLTFENAKDAMRFLKENDPQTYVLKRSAIESCFTRECRKRGVLTFNQFNVPFVNVNDDTCHIFVGPTGTGKTNFALAHFTNPVVISDRQDFSKINSETDGFILDDFCTRSWLSTNVLHIVDCALDRSINVKYGVATIPAHMSRIITTNDITLFWPTDILQATKLVIERHIVVHEFNEGSLFKKRKIENGSTLDISEPITDSVTDIAIPYKDSYNRSSMPFLSLYNQSCSNSNDKAPEIVQEFPVDLDEVLDKQEIYKAGIKFVAQSTPKRTNRLGTKLVDYSDFLSNISLPADFFCRF